VRKLPLLAATVLVAGCRVGPAYERPEAADLPFAFEGVAGDSGAESREIDLSDWWTRFGDDDLTRLVELAVVKSPDVVEQVARVLEARALRAAETGARLPQVEGDASYTRSRQSENLDGFAAFAGAPGAGATGGGVGFEPETDLWQAGGGVVWELDLFGRLARRVQAADRLLEAERFELAAVRVALAADVATTYVEVRELQNRLRIARENVAIQQNALRLARARFEGGLTTQLDVAEALASLQRTRAAVPALAESLQNAKNRLSVLTGEEPGFAESVIAEVAPVPPADLAVAVGVAAALARRRPDIRRAERELASAVASVGAREADLYPRLSLVGTFGFASGDVDDLFEWDSRTFGVGPSFNWPIFQGGTLRALVGAADARVTAAEAEYRRVVLTALQEVADALTALAQDRERRDVLAEGVEAARRAVELAEAQYADGLVDFDRVIDSQQLLFESEDALAVAEAALSRDLIALYRALGGGWRPEPIVKDDA